MNHERKGLDRKNRLYSILLAVILLGGLVGYFICMLPALYVSHRMEQNLKSVEVQHRTYVETGSYEGIKLANSTACFSVKIPDEGDCVFFTSLAWQVRLTADTPQAREGLAELRQFLRRWKDGDLPEDYDEERFFQEAEAWASCWREAPVALPVQVDVRFSDSASYESGGVKVHLLSDELVIAEATVSDGENLYTNYVAMEDVGNAMVFTFLPAMTPDMGDVRPVVLQSLPMLAAVVLLLVLLFSQAYSRGILKPVYRELEEKNLALQEENRRQEVFLRASSHQMKTPLSAALLLLDGMMNKVGKYQDTDAYLQKVKEQLLSMRKMVEDVLSLNHCKDDVHLQDVQVMPLLEGKLQEYRVVIAEKRLQVSCTGTDAVMKADEYLFLQVLDNLISNAAAYTPDGNKVEIRVSPTEICIENYGVTIPEDILPHIFDPFVSGNHEKTIASHGLGLYLAAYGARQMGFAVYVQNRENSVLATLSFGVLQ